MKIFVKDVIKHTDAKLLCGNLDDEVKNVFINTMNTLKDGTFFAIKDNYKYYKDALDKGAKVLVLPKCDINLKGYDNATVLISNDVLKCMQQLAAYKRSLFKGLVIGITGSVGKTTTKEFVYNVISKKHKVLKTVNNQNGQIGVALTILKISDEDVLLLEIGISKPGEMKTLTEISKPNIVIITNVFLSHIENFKDKDELLQEKLKILSSDKLNKVLVNNDNLFLENEKLITFSINNESLYKACNIKDGIITTFDLNNLKNIKINGNKNIIYDAIPAIILGKILGIKDDIIKEAISKIINEDHRLKLIKVDDYTIIDDTYNASFESMLNAIDYLIKFNKRKIVVLGDILEAGDNYKYFYKMIAKKLMEHNISYLITIGDKSSLINKKVKGIKSKHFKNVDDGVKFIKGIIKSDDVLLIKGSHGIKLFKLVDYLQNKKG